MAVRIWSRVHYFWTCINRQFKVLGALYAFVSFLTVVRDFIAPYANLQFWQLLPKWSWQTFLMIGVLLLFTAFFEGSYRYYLMIQREAQKKRTSLLDQYQHEIPPGKPPDNRVSQTLPILVALIIAVVWIVSHYRNECIASNDPFVMRGITALIAVGQTRSPIWATYDESGTGCGKVVASPVPVVAFISITNVQNHDDTIASYSVAFKTSRCGWIQLSPIPLAEVTTYSVSPGLDKAVLLDFESRGLDRALEKPIASHQTVNGWAIFDAPTTCDIRTGDAVETWITLKTYSGVPCRSCSESPVKGKFEPIGQERMPSQPSITENQEPHDLSQLPRQPWSAPSLWASPSCQK